ETSAGALDARIAIARLSVVTSVHSRGSRRPMAVPSAPAMHRRIAPAACSLSAALLCNTCGEPAHTRPIERVIVITCDTLRTDHLGVYGYTPPTSPGVDAFAKDAIVFDNAYSSAPLTGPSLSSMMSGRPPDEISV